MNFVPPPSGVIRGTQLEGFLSGTSNAADLHKTNFFGSTDYSYDNAIGYNHVSTTSRNQLAHSARHAVG
jgi:hypothetical protein